MSLIEESFPFKSVAGDRKYKADEWRNVMRAMFSNGVFPTLSQLQVAPGPGMSVVVSPGRACIDGVVYTLKDELTINLTAADGVLSRKDKIIVTVDESARDAYGAKLDGTPSASPAAASNRWTSSYKDICLAIVTVTAGITSIASGNISETQTEPALCGIAAPYQIPDTSGWFANFEASYIAWQAEQQSNFDEWFETMVATLDENVAGNLLNLINANKAELEGEIAAITPASIGAEPSRLQFTNTVVDNAAFVADATYTDFPFRAAVALSGVTNAMIPIVTLGAEDSASGIFAAVAISYNGGLYLYASEVPEADITIPTIFFLR